MGLRKKPSKIKSLRIDNLEYRQIKEFPCYYISRYGDVFSSHNQRILKWLNNGKNYMQVSLQDECSSKVFKRYIHRLVAKAWLSNPENKKEVNHIDGNKKNNSIINLEWCTRQENQNHSFKILKNPTINDINKKLKRGKYKIMEF